ncbi:hypothetical protein QUF72_05555 [Desulfobacterales bacterium HSG2]|nr:hypothetical protein [Desulfobacterales bacterium HSG2]
MLNREYKIAYHTKRPFMCGDRMDHLSVNHLCEGEDLPAALELTQNLCHEIEELLKTGEDMP